MIRLTIDLLLAIGLGLAVGAFLVLWLDTHFWGGHLQKIKQDKKKIVRQISQQKEQLRVKEEVLATAQEELHTLRQEMRVLPANNKIQTGLTQLRAEVAELRVRLQALEQENQDLRRRLMEARRDNQRLRENSEQISAKWILSEHKKEDTQKILARRESDLRQVLHVLTTTKSIAQKWINKYRSLEAEKQQLDARLQAMQAKVDLLQAQLTQPGSTPEQESGLRGQLDSAQSELTAARLHKRSLDSQAAELQDEMAETIAHKLEEIRGIGPTYAKRLRENGVRTLADLMRKDPEELADIVQLRGPKSQPEAWIEEAKTLHGAEDTGVTAPGTTAAPSEPHHQDLPPWQPASG
jgi:predicted flap endonuclease-1-like 5' DNA nuclease